MELRSQATEGRRIVKDRSRVIYTREIERERGKRRYKRITKFVKIKIKKKSRMGIGQHHS